MEKLHCGSKPKKVAIGIAPLGTISIGIVPMGVICIGIVPMGVISIGVVSMGLVSASIVGMGLISLGVNTMGLITAGPMSMGVIQLGSEKEVHNHNLIENKSQSFMTYPTKIEASEKAILLGCSGAHKMGSKWMPCNLHTP